MALSPLALLNKAAPAKPPIVGRPDGAADCALEGCGGWVAPDKALFVTRDGKALSGVCPKKEVHARLAAGSEEVRTIRQRMTQLFHDLNPGPRLIGAPTVQQVVDGRTGKPIGVRLSNGQPVA